MPHPSPANVFDHVDPGDDTIARFHYQFATAAIHAINIARGVGSAKAIICENFEDIILERHDSKFDAIQVKTSDRHRPPFKLSDNAVEKSLIRFIKLNMKFPGQFSGFYFETNHEMWSDKENSQNAEWVINEIRRNPRVKGLRRTNGKRAAVDKLRVRSNAPVDVVVETLSKTNFRSRKEDVTSVHSLLHQAMLTHPQCCDLKYHRIIALSDALIAAVFRASSRAQIAFSDRLYEVDEPLDAAIEQAILSGKRLTADSLSAIISENVGIEDEMVDISDLIDLKNLPTGLAKMWRKMAKGGVEAARIQLMSDLVRSLENLEVGWVHRYGSSKARAMTKDLMSRTLSECIEAQVEASKTGVPYGSIQYAETKRRLEDKCQRDHASLHGCKPEHLMGAAGALTESCKLWWSDRFDIEEKTS